MAVALHKKQVDGFYSLSQRIRANCSSMASSMRCINRFSGKLALQPVQRKSTERQLRFSSSGWRQWSQRGEYFQPLGLSP